jgi:hypothetical protein
MKRILISVMGIMLAASGMAQETTTTFKPSGKPVVTVFTDFRVQSTDGKTNWHSPCSNRQPSRRMSCWQRLPKREVN